MSALLARADVPSALYQPVPVAWYEPGRRTELPLETLADLADFAGRGSAAWLDAWLLAGAAAQHAVDLILAASAAATGPSVGALVWKHARGQLVLGSSNGIRDVDLAGAPARGTAGHRLRQPGPGRDRRHHRPPPPASRSAAGRKPPCCWATSPSCTTPAGCCSAPGEAEPHAADRGAQRRRRGHLRAPGARRGRRGGRATATPSNASSAPRSRWTSRRSPRRTASRTARSARRRNSPRRCPAPLEGRSIIEVRTDRHGLRELHRAIRAAVAAAVEGLPQT